MSRKETRPGLKPSPKKGEPTPEATIFVIFGIIGDLAWRKLIPALFSLYLNQRMPEKFAVYGLGRREFSDEGLRQHLYDGLEQVAHHQPIDHEQWKAFAENLHYMQGDFTTAEPYPKLVKELKRLEKDWDTETNQIFYMATPPELFAPIGTMLGESGLAADREHSRLVIEKPIGRDLESAIELNKTLMKHFEESQLYRIDHYLGKETVQNILAFRFANPMFEPIWNRRYVDHVAITVAEDMGVENRAGYYDHSGALRDMVQNHLLQLLCLVAMEPPIAFEADEVRNKKVDVLHAIRKIDPTTAHEVAVRGQYGAGWVEGKHVQAYRDEPGVDPESQTETFAALKLFVNNWRWQDVPFYLRTGKYMPEKVSEISIRFKDVPHQTFPDSAMQGHHPGRIVICIQPNEGIILKFHAKEPGQGMRLRPVDMTFNYGEAFNKPSPEAYETLLWDVMLKDVTLFMRADQVEAAWKILMPVFENWEANPAVDFPNYPAGSWGPEAAEGLISSDSRYWLMPTVLEEGCPSESAVLKALERERQAREAGKTKQKTKPAASKQTSGDSKSKPKSKEAVAP